MSSATVTETTYCRLCGSEGLGSVVDLGDQIPGCFYPRSADEYLPRAPLHLVRCLACGLGQLSHTMAPEDLYRHGYGYRSGQTRTMRVHLADVVRRAAEYVDLHAGDLVVDIGCNDGTLLSFWDSSLRRIGFDPVAGQFSFAPGLDIVAERFSIESYDSRFSIESYGLPPAKAITACAMLYDLDDPLAFLRDVAAVLHPEGVLVVEVMYAGAMLRGAWDMISHEHLTYWDFDLLSRAMNETGLYAADAELLPVNGGTLRVVARKNGETGRVFARRPPIPGGGFSESHAELWEDFRSRVLRSIGEIKDAIQGLSGSGETVDVLGASQKGNTLLQSVGIDRKSIRWASERDPRKHGALTPGSWIQIVSEEQSRSARPDAYLVLPWHFRDEILEREVMTREAGTRMIFPLPRLEVV